MSSLNREIDKADQRLRMEDLQGFAEPVRLCWIAGLFGIKAKASSQIYEPGYHYHNRPMTSCYQDH